MDVAEVMEMIKSFDRKFFADTITSFIADYFEKAGAETAIIGVSGGVDSATVLYLTVRALRKDRVVGVILPREGVTPGEDIRDALAMINSLGVKHYLFYVDKPFNAFVEKVEEKGIKLNKVAKGNILARTRMIFLFALANSMNGLVVGTGDKSELLIGYFTKYGDGGVDLLPIGDVYKTQVRLLAEYIGVPKHVAYKPSSPRLWPGQMAATELGVDYTAIDPILYALVELRMKPSEVKKIKGVEPRLVDMLVERIKRNEHKRQTPKVAKVQHGPTFGEDWKYPLWMS